MCQAPSRQFTLFRAVQNDRLRLMDHEYLGLGDIQRAAGSGAQGALFDSLYVLQNFLDEHFE